MALNQHDDFRICRDEIQHEYNVLSGRLTSYITSQAFLMSAYSISMNNTNDTWGDKFRLVFPVLVCLIGIMLSLRAHPGIASVCGVIQAWHGKQDRLFRDFPDLEEYNVLQKSGAARDNLRNLTFAQGSTWIFGTSWLFMGGIAYWMSTIPPKVLPCK